MLSFVIICSVSRVRPTPRPSGIHFFGYRQPKRVLGARCRLARVGLKREVE